MKLRDIVGLRYVLFICLNTNIVDTYNLRWIKIIKLKILWKKNRIDV